MRRFFPRFFLVHLVGEVESQLPVRPVSAKEWQAQSQVPELDIPSDLRLALLQSRHLTDLQRFDFPELKFLTDNLERENWLGCPRARLARAVRAGLSAREKLEGRLTATVASPSLPSGGRSLWYVCLRSPRFPTGFLTQNYRCYISEVQDQHRKFHPTGVSHSFPLFGGSVSVPCRFAGPMATRSSAVTGLTEAFIPPGIS